MSKIISSRTSQFSQYISFQQSQSPLTSALRPPSPPLPPIVFFFFLGSAFPLLNLLLLYDPQMKNKNKNKNKNKKPGSYAGCLPYNFLCSMEHSCGGARLRRPSLILLMFRAWINSTQWKHCSNWRLVGSIATRCAENPAFLSKRRRNKGAPFERSEMSFDGGADTK